MAIDTGYLKRYRESRNLKSFSCNIDRELLTELEILLARKQMSKTDWLIEKINEELKKGDLK